MKKIPFTATEAEIAQILDGILVRDSAVNTQYAAMAYLSMCRHPYICAEWLIAEFVWIECIAKISECAGQDTAETIKNRIKQLYQDKANFTK